MEIILRAIREPFQAVWPVMHLAEDYCDRLCSRASSFDVSESENHSIRTCAIPDFNMPSALAAARETSMTRPFSKGPRSLIRTSTDLPLVKLMTFTLLPQGKVR